MKNNNIAFGAAVLFVLMLLAGCQGVTTALQYSIKPEAEKIEVGESLQLKGFVHVEPSDDGCFTEKPRTKACDPGELIWSVEPAGAAITNRGMFKASRPGKYRVAIETKEKPEAPVFEKSAPKPAIITVMPPEKTEKNTENSNKTDDRNGPGFMEDKPEGEPVQIFKVGSDLAVQNGGTSPSFTMARNHWITTLTTYHWNNGSGAAPGTISLKSENGKTYGPWKTKGSDGQGGVKNAYWTAEPKITLPAGKYTVIDSDPSTWAQNSESGGQGMAWMSGIPEE